MPRCFSKCRGVKEEDCKHPCSFIAKKYCRLSSQYKMDPPDCDIVRKESSSHRPKPKPRPIKRVTTLTKPLSIQKMLTIVPKSISPKVVPTVLPKATTVMPKATKASTKATLKGIPKTIKSPKAPKTIKTKVSKVSKSIVKTLAFPSIKMPPVYQSRKNRENRISTLKKFQPKDFAAKKIQTFMKKTEGKRKSRFLQAICADSGVCIAFGKEKDKLMDFFQFDRFTYAMFPTKTIGEPSGNGFVKQIRYERENYQAYAVLKSAKNFMSDNMAYEYLVGKYLNEKSKQFPVLLETYGLFTYQDSLERIKHLTKHQFTSQLTPLDPYDIQKVCMKTSTECILIQYLKDVKTLHQMKSSLPFFLFESPYVLYHIYFALYHLRKDFTHYDLHTGNVLISEPVKGKYIEYHYHLPNETVVFQSKYMVKIIDYGRCFFPGAPAYYEKLMAESECKKGQGLIDAFAYLRKDRSADDSKFFVNPYYKNESHDLKVFRGYGTCLDLFPTEMATFKTTRLAPYIELFKKIVFENVKYPHLTQYGTKEDLTHDDKIRNVTDAEEQLRKWILDAETMRVNKRQFKPSQKLGEFHVYSDGRDMVYKPV